jgi:hypothetical protein
MRKRSDCNHLSIALKVLSQLDLPVFAGQDAPVHRLIYCGISTKRSASIGDDRRKPKQVDREKKHEKADLGKILHPRQR